MRRIVDFDGADLENMETRFENRYQFAYKLLSQDLSAICDLNDYLKCNNQLEYIGNLAKPLENYVIS